MEEVHVHRDIVLDQEIVLYKTTPGNRGNREMQLTERDADYRSNRKSETDSVMVLLHRWSEEQRLSLRFEGI